jgi:ferritin-like metal-binding protein YciE
MIMNTFEQGMTKLLVAQLAELYHCENQLLHALDRMAEAAMAPDLKQVFREHRRETMNHVSRLEEAFAALGETPRSYPCRMVDGLLEDGTWLLHRMKGDPMLDRALINAAQATEMMEAAAYKRAISMAGYLGMDKVVELCDRNLEEELAAATKVNGLTVLGRAANDDKGEGDLRS